MSSRWSGNRTTIVPEMKRRYGAFVDRSSASFEFVDREQRKAMIAGPAGALERWRCRANWRSMRTQIDEMMTELVEHADRDASDRATAST